MFHRFFIAHDRSVYWSNIQLNCDSMKILNLYSGLGGNRKLWGDTHDITSVEIDPEIASLYKGLYPNDEVIIGDAHQFLIENLNEGWDLIWSSPPCPTHSRINTDGNRPQVYPDMTLYQQIIMLSNNWYKGKWVVENVIPYYTPLIHPTVKMDRHLFWSNFYLSSIPVKREKPLCEQSGTNERYGFNLKGVKVKCDKRKVLRNLVNPEIGLYILNRAFDIVQDNNVEQLKIFNHV